MREAAQGLAVLATEVLAPLPAVLEALQQITPLLAAAPRPPSSRRSLRRAQPVPPAVAYTNRCRQHSQVHAGWNDGSEWPVTAWLWLRYQPASKHSRWFQERFGGGSSRQRRIGIIALARRLLIDLWRFIETGAVPEGARLKMS